MTPWFSWLPMYHEGMGLIACLWLPLWSGSVRRFSFLRRTG